MNIFHRIFSAVAAAALACGITLPIEASAQSAAVAAAPTVRVRGTVVYADTKQLIVKDRGGEVVSMARVPNLPVSEVYRIKLADIKKGSFIGTAAMPQPDGTQKALEVLVFPEAARGTGEGHFPWDLQPQSTMTNATVAGQAVSAADGSRLKLTYPGGEKTIVVAPGTPVVSLRPGSRELLVPGAGVSVTAQVVEDKPTAMRVSTGRNGFAPPY